MAMCDCDMNGHPGFHCRACCLTFTSVSAFDQHITGSGHVPPPERGLVLTQRGIWGWPGSHPSFRALGREEAS